MSLFTQPRRAILCVPAGEPRKIEKALALDVDEVVIDLEDAVAPADKTAALASIGKLTSRGRRGRIAVRVNAIGTPWHKQDVAACIANPVVDSIVLPKAENPTALAELAHHLDGIEGVAGSRTSMAIQALIESPAGLVNANALATAKRVVALIIGYADLSASMGRRIDASWQSAQDSVLLAARCAGIQALDGPLLTIAVDERLRTAAREAAALGFDGKWVIHPAQVPDVQQAFTPSVEEATEAREIIAALESAAAQGRGALQWRGQMLDEAVAVRARRILVRANSQGGEDK